MYPSFLLMICEVGDTSYWHFWEKNMTTVAVTSSSSALTYLKLFQFLDLISFKSQIRILRDMTEKLWIVCK